MYINLLWCKICSKPENRMQKSENTKLSNTVLTFYTLVSVHVHYSMNYGISIQL